MKINTSSYRVIKKMLSDSGLVIDEEYEADLVRKAKLNLSIAFNHFEMTDEMITKEVESIRKGGKVIEVHHLALKGIPILNRRSKLPKDYITFLERIYFEEL